MGLLSTLNLQAPNVRGRAGAAAPVAKRSSEQSIADDASGVQVRADSGPTSTLGGDARSAFPGLGQDDLRNVAAKARRPKAPPAALTEIVFDPKARVLTSVHFDAIPNAIRAGEETTIDLVIDNWEVEAPGTATTRWSAEVSGTAIEAAIVPDPGSPSKAYLTVTGKKPASMGSVAVRITVLMPGAQSKTKLLVNFFFSCDAAAAPDPDIEKARRLDGGGKVTQSELDQDLTNLLQDWMQAASIGISQFATASLESKINGLGEVDKRTFFLNLIGNVLWAATVFNIGGSVALKLVAKGIVATEERGKQVVSFTISMAGIVGPAVDSFVRAGAGANTITAVREAMDGANQKWYQYMQVTLAGKISGLADMIASATRYEATNEICRAMFKPGTVKIDAKGQLKPTINMDVVSNRYRTIASVMLDKYQAESSKDVLTKSFDQHDREEIKANRKPKTLR